ncbi:MAG: hypothetical protein ACYDA4_05605 [Ignavibacteriaceae bacterium]
MKKSKIVISVGDELPESIDKLLSNPYFKKLQSFGLIDEIAVRNFIIKNEYRDLRNKMSLGDAVDQLSQKYLLSESAINNILFRKRNRKLIQYPAIKF